MRREPHSHLIEQSNRMETSTTQLIKLALVSMTGLSKDALHVHVGLAVLLSSAFILRRRLSSFIPWAIVLAAAMLGEVLDMRDDLSYIGFWRWRSSLHDVVNTIFWPSALMALARFGIIFRAARKRGISV
jgi:hypothetical protein